MNTAGMWPVSYLSSQKLQEENLWPKQVKLVKNHSVQIRMKIKKWSAICVALLSCASAFALNEIPEEYLTDGFALGCQA
ncbi:MAG: hypothetical protein ACTHMT_11275, partial [Verrucomicrobiota bacterium]